MDNSIKHIAIIMDGNRRWARKQGKSPFEGHKIGEECIEPIVDHAMELGIPYLTFWAFSTENWKREKEEVSFLMSLFREGLHKKVDSFHKKNVRVNVIGNLAMFPEDIQKIVTEWIERTKNNTMITVNIALSYGGRDEIMRAVNKHQTSSIKHQDLTPDIFSKFLDTAGQPDPDLLIRTGGQKRLSGFMLWQLEYAELYFTDVLWPDFTPREFDRALGWCHEQQRNFGK